MKIPHSADDPFIDDYTHPMLLCKSTEPIYGGYVSRYRFRNGLGASVVHHENSYDRELAVIKFGPIVDGNAWDFDLTYDTTITSDVVGYIDSDLYLETLLNRIGNYPADARWLEGAVLEGEI